MDLMESTSSSVRGTGRVDLSSLVSDARINASRRVNFTSSTPQEKTASGSLANLSENSPGRRCVVSRQGANAGGSTQLPASQSAASPRSSSSLRPSQSRSGGISYVPQQKSNSALSFARFHSSAGVQGSQSSEPEYWAHTAPPVTTAVNRVSTFASKEDEQAVDSDSTVHSGSVGARRSSGIERLLGTDLSNSYEGQEVPVGTLALRQALKALKEATRMEEAEEMQELPDLQEPIQEQEFQTVNGSRAGATWRKRTTRTSTHYPICARTARERCAYTTSDDWAIFSMHSQYVRPLRDREWVPGEPCIIRKDSFELPPGACRYSESTSGLPATAFNSFVFPNPPRQFLMPSRGSSRCFELGKPSMGFRAGRVRQSDRRRSTQLTQEQLLDLERMLWFDPEPRLERPFRLYADSKACLKGPIHDIGHIMRSGW